MSTDILHQKIVTVTVYYYGDEPQLYTEGGEDEWDSLFVEDALRKAIASNNPETRVVDTAIDEWRDALEGYERRWSVALRRIITKLIHH
jgi:hypothetical protein